MFTRKDRKIANLKAKVNNRDILILNQQKKIAKLEATIRAIKSIASSNLCGTDGTIYLRKIKELSTTLDGVR